MGLEWYLANSTDYVGTKSTHLTALFDYNQPINGQLPYPNFGYIEYRTPTGNGIYNGLDLTVERRMQSGLTFRFAYTLSKSIDNAAEPSVPTPAVRRTAATLRPGADRATSIFVTAPY